MDQPTAGGNCTEFSSIRPAAGQCTSHILGIEVGPQQPSCIVGMGFFRQRLEEGHLDNKPGVKASFGEHQQTGVSAASCSRG